MEDWGAKEPDLTGDEISLAICLKSVLPIE